MKRHITITVITFLLVGVLGCWAAKKSYQKNPSLPVLSGNISVEGLEGEVNVYRDEYGIPHIFSENEHDLFFATGYVQAQDRLWEMVLLRAISEGRISELVGDISVPGQSMMGMPLSTTGIDTRQRTIGLKWLGEVGEEILKEKDPKIYDQLVAFCDGINTFIDTRDGYKELPIEFQVLRVKPEPFRPADIISLGRFIGSMLAGNMDAELLRYGLIDKYGADLGWTLAPLHTAHGPTIVPPEILKNKLDTKRDLPPGGRPSDAEIGYSLPLSHNDAFGLLMAETSIKSMLYDHYPLASNNWVVGPKMTETKTAMLANDPHLSHIEPSLFYMIRMKGAGFDTYGVTFPGNPYIALGHTKKLSWGATTSIADVQDLFIETVDSDHPGMYKYKGEWRPFTIREEILKVRVGHHFINKKIKIRQSIHGPIINDISGLSKDAPPIALRWVAWTLTEP